MSFNLARQLQSNPQSPSPSSLSSLDDEASARVYFGPIQSPERIFIAQATQKWNDLSSMPIRRSPRISSLQNSQQLACLGEEMRAVGTTLGEQCEPQVDPPLAAPTPEDSSQDDIDLEPASALATKISRAHDNPSPPPNMQPLMHESNNPTSPTPTEHHHLSDSDSAAPEAPSSAIADESLPRAQTLISPPVSHEASPTLDHRPATSPPINASTDMMVVCDDNVSDVPKVAAILEPSPDLLVPTPLWQPAHFLGGLESISRTTLSDTLIRSLGNEGPEQDHTPAAITSPSSNRLTAESPVPRRRSPRLSRLGSPSVHSNQSGLVQRDEADPSDTHSPLEVTQSSETAGHVVVTEPPRRVRELGSLSPVSENILHNLLSPRDTTAAISLNQLPALTSAFPANQLSHSRPSTPEHQPLPEQQNDSVPFYTVQRPPVEQRSPWRNLSTKPGSPSKFDFYNTDYKSTPQRIPIKEAIAQGSASPRKTSSAASAGIFGRPVFARYTPEDRIPSPVQRPPSDVANHTVAASSGIARHTASASPKKVRSESEEPQFSRRLHVGRPFQRSASDSEISSPSKTKIPTISIRSGVDIGLPGTIPEEHEVDSPMKSPQSTPSSKSALRQPSSVAGSRIPRIGTKAYARPPEKEKQESKGMKPIHKLFMTKRPTSSGSALTKQVRIVKNVNATGSGSSSEEPAGVRAANPQPSPSLKRKRSLEEVPVAQPTFVRLVPSLPRQRVSSISPLPPRDSGIVAKKPRIGHVRTVGDIAAQKSAARSAGTQPLADETAEQQPARTVSLTEEPQIALPAPPLTPPPASYINPDLSTPGIQAGPAASPDIRSIALQSELNAKSFNSLSDSLSLDATRLTRSRRNPQPTSDIFGPVRPLQPRRRRTVEAQGENAFSSMSALALKALTTSNTARNQYNLAAVLETEVIRKSGTRPGSPTTKVKTIDEKRKVEQGQGRRERAERRARRASEPMEDSSLTSEDEESLPVGPDGLPLRHRRGPGDEEEYESPERPEKRMRVGEAGEREEEGAVKTVRWDRGLFTTFYFDDLPLQSQAHDKPQATPSQNRGALAGSAKAIRLDGLGNLANATSPLKDVVPENVVIKKYVYDDDVEAAMIDAPKPPSRGKGKKLKG
ncbi:hypothetical protein BC827DRAFT_686670 [Russula dissimulans]|nr:hypothetical protein BC827DRAFT_686670 [Russula dissimulans]